MVLIYTTSIHLFTLIVCKYILIYCNLFTFSHNLPKSFDYCIFLLILRKTVYSPVSILLLYWYIAYTRKLYSLIINLSSNLFSYIWSGMIVVLGIYINVYSKNKTKWDNAFVDYYNKLTQRKRRLTTVRSLEV